MITSSINSGPTLSGEDRWRRSSSAVVGNATWAGGGSGLSRQVDLIPLYSSPSAAVCESSRRKSERAALT